MLKRDGDDWRGGRKNKLSSPVDKDRQDFTIYSGDWAKGCIYQQRGGPESMRWFWSCLPLCSLRS
jgi:hypothetical protein